MKIRLLIKLREPDKRLILHTVYFGGNKKKEAFG